MTNKSINQSRDVISNYIKEVEAAKKQEKAKPTNIIETLRADMLPSSQVIPAEKESPNRKVIKHIVDILLILLIFGLFWYLLAGPGHGILEERLKSLNNNTQNSTPQRVQVVIASTKTAIFPSETPHQTVTSIPTHTQIQVVENTPTPFRPTYTLIPSSTNAPSVTATPTPDCYNVLNITLADVGKTLCVQGVVKETITNPTDFMVIFSQDSGAFYWVTYDMVWLKGEEGHCYRMTGKIDRIINSPIMIFDYSNIPQECP